MSSNLGLFADHTKDFSVDKLDQLSAELAAIKAQKRAEAGKAAEAATLAGTAKVVETGKATETDMQPSVPERKGRARKRVKTEHPAVWTNNSKMKSLAVAEPALDAEQDLGRGQGSRQKGAAGAVRAVPKVATKARTTRGNTKALAVGTSTSAHAMSGQKPALQDGILGREQRELIVQVLASLRRMCSQMDEEERSRKELLADLAHYKERMLLVGVMRGADAIGGKERAVCDHLAAGASETVREHTRSDLEGRRKPAGAASGHKQLPVAKVIVEAESEGDDYDTSAEVDELLSSD